MIKDIVAAVTGTAGVPGRGRNSDNVVAAAGMTLAFGFDLVAAPVALAFSAYRLFDALIPAPTPARN